MKQITLLKTWLIALALMIFGVGGMMAVTVEFDFSQQGYVNAEEVPSGVIDPNISFEATKGGNNTAKYYAVGTGLRVYNGGQFIIKPDDVVITKITLSFAGTGYTFNSDDPNPTIWTGSSSDDVSFSVGRTSRLQKVEVEYVSDGPLPAIAPSFSVEAGGYLSAQTVAITSETENAKIYYTLDESDPSKTSTLYSSPINIASTTTVKAIAYDASNENPSSISTAVYTIVTNTHGDGSKENPFTIADVILLDNVTGSKNSYWVKGYIVGGVPAGTGGVLTSVQTSDFGNSALTLADDVDEDDFEKMIPVQLPAGDVRNALNLADNPVNFKQGLSIYGTLESYFTAPGIKNPSDYELFITGVTELDTPTATDATGIGASKFTANWNAVDDAEEYVLSVYTKEVSEAGPELVVNGGFEDDFEDWTLTEGSSLSIETNDPYAGNKYASRTGTKTIRLEQIIDVEVGKEYTFSFWYNNYDATNANGIKNYTIHGTGASSYIEGGNPKKLLEATEWTKYEQVFTAEEDKVKISIRVYQEADIDEVSLKANAGAEVELPITGSPFTVTGTSYGITGLAAETDYYYVVKAVAGVVESDWSNEVKATTGPITNVTDVHNASSVFAQNDRVMINTTAGTLIEIFNVSGQRISTTVAHDGLNTIPVVNKGVLLVKVGEQIRKVVM